MGMPHRCWRCGRALGSTERTLRGFDREVAVLKWAAMLRFVHLSAPVSRLGFQSGGGIRDREGWRLG
ncbi:unnamed protein product [Linum trigynum]|uniref:Uncharacterized protein n=1 Tax=Linum trigynum TaxID=586398 RepID=A0AAV2DD61_9ROSI